MNRIFKGHVAVVVAVYIVAIWPCARANDSAASSAVGDIQLKREPSISMANAQPEWYLPTGDGCSLFVQEFGQGPETIIVLHGGWGAEHSYLIDPLKDLENKYHLVFYDQRGSLLSPCPVEKISVQKHIEDLERLRQALKVARFSVIAHSMGTYLAMSYQQEHPDHLKGMVLLGAFTPSTPRSEEEKLLLQTQQNFSAQFIKRVEIAKELSREGLDGDPATLTPQQTTAAWRIHFAGANIFHLDRVNQVKGGKAYFNNSAGQAAGKTMPQTWDFSPALAARSCSTWVIDGDHDYADPSGKSFQLATHNIPGVHIVVLKDAGHNSWIDAPDEFSNALGKALESTMKCTETHADSVSGPNKTH
jgi:proline iminopeptidase